MLPREDEKERTFLLFLMARRTIKGNKKYFVQVAYSIADDKAYDREFRAFKDIDNLSQKIIITNDDVDYSTSTVRHIQLRDFLAMQDLTD